VDDHKNCKRLEKSFRVLKDLLGKAQELKLSASLHFRKVLQLKSLLGLKQVTIPELILKHRALKHSKNSLTKKALACIKNFARTSKSPWVFRNYRQNLLHKSLVSLKINILASQRKNFVCKK